MRKFLGLIFVVLFAISTFILMVTLNIRFGLISAPKIKMLASESNIYEIAAGSIREQLAAQAGNTVSDGQILEIITEAVSSKNLQEVSESGIDSFFNAVNDPEHNSQIIIPTSKLGQDIIQVAEQKLGVANLAEAIQSQNLEGAPDVVKMLQEDQVIDLSSQPIFRVLTQAQYLVLAVIIPCIFLTLLLFFIPSDTASGRFAWLGSGFIFSAIGLAAITAFCYFYAVGFTDKIITSFDFSDQKIVTGAKRLVALVVDNQKLYLLIETISSFVVGLVLILLGRGVKEEKLAMFEDEKEGGNTPKSDAVQGQIVNK